MKPILLASTPVGVATYSPGAEPRVAQPKTGFRPRLRRWFRKFRQYGRIELDLGGLLYLGVVAGLAATVSVPAPPLTAGDSPAQSLAQPAQLAAASLNSLVTSRGIY